MGMYLSGIAGTMWLAALVVLSIDKYWLAGAFTVKKVYTRYGSGTGGPGIDGEGNKDGKSETHYD